MFYVRISCWRDLNVSLEPQRRGEEKNAENGAASALSYLCSVVFNNSSLLSVSAVQKSPLQLVRDSRLLNCELGAFEEYAERPAEAGRPVGRKW
jgi:hypothetical protein